MWSITNMALGREAEQTFCNKTIRIIRSENAIIQPAKFQECDRETDAGDGPCPKRFPGHKSKPQSIAIIIIIVIICALHTDDTFDPQLHFASHPMEHMVLKEGRRA
jgi:hypothetical protein